MTVAPCLGPKDWLARMGPWSECRLANVSGGTRTAHSNARSGRRHSPELNGVIVRTRDEAAIGQKRESVDALCVPIEVRLELTRCQIPKRDRTVILTCSKPLIRQGHQRGDPEFAPL